MLIQLFRKNKSKFIVSLDINFRSPLEFIFPHFRRLLTPHHLSPKRRFNFGLSSVVSQMKAMHRYEKRTTGLLKISTIASVLGYRGKNPAHVENKPLIEIHISSKG